MTLQVTGQAPQVPQGQLYNQRGGEAPTYGNNVPQYAQPQAPQYQTQVQPQPQYAAPQYAPQYQTPVAQNSPQDGFGFGQQLVAPQYGQAPQGVSPLANQTQYPAVGTVAPLVTDQFGQPVQAVPQVQPQVQTQVQTQQQGQPQVAPTAQLQFNTSASDNPLELSINYFAQSNGIDPQAIYDAIAPAVQYGDTNLLNLSLQSVVQNLAPEQKAYAQQLAFAAYNSAQAEVQQTIQAAYAAAGGQQQWEAAKEHFKQVASPEIREAAAALDRTGNAQAAIQLVLNTVRGYGYGASPEGQALQGGTNPVAVRGLSKEQYHQELNKLYKEVGNQNAWTDPRFAQLNQQRHLGMQQGI